MDWQEAVSLCIVAAALVLLVTAKLRRRKFKFEGGMPCCCGASAPQNPGSIVFHARKGERREIIVKMK